MSSESERLRTQAAILELLAYWPADDEPEPPHLTVNGFDPFATEEDVDDDGLEDDVEAFWAALEDEPEEPSPKSRSE